MWYTKKWYDFSRDQIGKPTEPDLNLWPYTSVADSDDVLENIQYIVLLPFPVSTPCSPSSISWQHVLNKALILRNILAQELSLGESKLPYSSTLNFSPSMHLPNFCSDPQNSFQRVVSVWHFQASSIIPDKSAYAWSILSAGLIFSVATSFISWFLSRLIAWRTLAWKD